MPGSEKGRLGDGDALQVTKATRGAARLPGPPAASPHSRPSAPWRPWHKGSSGQCTVPRGAARCFPPHRPIRMGSTSLQAPNAPRGHSCSIYRPHSELIAVL